jgi:hypothetical protein
MVHPVYYYLLSTGVLVQHRNLTLNAITFVSLVEIFKLYVLQPLYKAWTEHFNLSQLSCIKV